MRNNACIVATEEQVEILNSYNGEHYYECEVGPGYETVGVHARNRNQARARVERVGLEVYSVNMMG